jgi:ADP-dependent NAD(P)H-hydrate dehydratase / NAD(P)H-hydrate epimerase
MSKKQKTPIKLPLAALPSYFGVKVISSAEMARVEKLAVQEGCKEEAFIEEAGRKVAIHATQFIEEHHLPKNVYLLVGKGNKGADAYAAGAALLEEGFKVLAYPCFSPESCSEWNRKMGERFLKKRGQTVRFYETQEIRFEDGLIIDGLLGTGFKDKVDGKIETAILVGNASNQPILAIDVPSGLDGTTGRASGACIKAAQTVTLGMAKSGLFFRDGWNHAGRIVVEDFGLPDRFVRLSQEIAYLPDPARLLLPKIVRNRHKYQAGYVVGYSGSDSMRGAPKMAGLAALRAGAGIVRLFSKGDIGNAPMELICRKWNAKEWRQELKRASSVFAGPGLGAGSMGWMKDISIPCVIDADALQKDAKFPKLAILTPHRGEMLRLLGLKSAPEEEDFLSRCQKFVERQHAILVLKGAPTILFAHGMPPLIIPRGDPGMATAGAGDVLTGILAGLLAQKMDPYDAAATGTYLHAVAGEQAAVDKTSYGLIASDLIHYLPKAFQELMNAGSG